MASNLAPTSEKSELPTSLHDDMSTTEKLPPSSLTDVESPQSKRLSVGTTPTLVEWEEDATAAGPGGQLRPDSVDIDLEAEPPTNKILEDHQVDDAYPEGGRGWFVVLGSFLLSTCSFGLVSGWGVFQAQYQLTILSHVNPSTLAWIGSVQYALVVLPGLVAGRLFDIGYLHSVLIPSSVFLVVATFLTGECKEFWQFMLAQGIATGLGCGMVFGPSLPVVSHWFKKRRATAFGVVAVGSSYGGTVFPIIIRRLIPAVGLPWTLRIIGFILLFHLTIANLLVRRRLPPIYAAGGLFNLQAFKSAPYTLYTIAGTVAFLGLYACLTFIDASGIRAGLSSNFSFYLVSIANASSGVGRITSGVLSDKIGSLNVLIPFTILAGIFTFIWPHCTTQASLVVIAILYGISSGAFVGLVASPVAQLGDTSDIGRRTGMMFTCMAVGAVVGPPISGAIYSSSGGFNDVGIYAGVTIMLCAALMFAARWKALGGLWGRF